MTAIGEAVRRAVRATPVGDPERAVLLLIADLDGQGLPAPLVDVAADMMRAELRDR